MKPAARGRGRRDVAQERKRPVAFVAKAVQVFAGLARGIASGGVRGVLVVGFEPRIIGFQHLLNARAESGGFHVCQMHQRSAEGFQWSCSSLAPPISFSTIIGVCSSTANPGRASAAATGFMAPPMCDPGYMMQ